ncbi:YkvA family protein [Aeromonas schubertii]|uniref:YkvA family protein n=1 Tax=Aeromonas schubertii TaxID=652 RepID=UPI0010A8F346|nr:DUF1232 domain-containing protein [Aeromonas schubertii]QCG48363.1 DUF1232 domain-containing protein [Aeromonas schubertii]
MKRLSLLHRLWRGLRHPATPLWCKGLAVLLFLYLISPWDLLPDVIPLLGWCDDATLVLLFLWGWVRLLPLDVRQAIGESE